MEGCARASAPSSQLLNGLGTVSNHLYGFGDVAMQWPCLYDVCRDHEDISNDVLKLEQFPVPQFMIDKMKKFMKSVQGESGRE